MPIDGMILVLCFSFPIFNTAWHFGWHSIAVEFFGMFVILQDSLEIDHAMFLSLFWNDYRSLDPSG